MGLALLGRKVLQSLRLYPRGHWARLGTLLIGTEEAGKGHRCCQASRMAQHSPTAHGSLVQMSSAEPGPWVWRECFDSGSPGLGKHGGRIPDAPLGSRGAWLPRPWTLGHLICPFPHDTWTPHTVTPRGPAGHLFCAKLRPRE